MEDFGEFAKMIKISGKVDISTLKSSLLVILKKFYE